MIGIFGDSFANDTQWDSNRSWTSLLPELLNEKYVCYGKSSTSIWWSYELFLKHFKKYDKIVFTYSHYSRWSYLPEHLTELSLIRPGGLPGGFDSHRDTSLKKYVDILLKAHPILYSEELQLFTYQNIFNSVNKLCKENNIKLINLMPFEHNTGNVYGKDTLNIDLSEAYGSCLTGLMEISINEAMDEHGKVHYDVFTRYSSKIDPRASHISLENNKVLASIIADKFNSNQTEVKNLSEDPIFLKGLILNEN